MVGGTGSLTKTNNGTLLLTDPNNTFSGGVSISGGNLAVAGDACLGNSGGTVTINGGALEFTKDTTSVHTLNLANAESYVQVDSGTVTHTGLITGPGGLVKSGTGTLAVTNSNNDYGGQTAVDAGTLLDNDSTGLALGTGTSAILVYSGAQLAGTGTVSQPVTCKGGSISPGCGFGDGHPLLQQGLTLNNQSSITFKLSSASGSPLSDCIDFEPNTSSGLPVAGLQTTGTCTVYLAGMPVPITTQPYVLFDHYHTSSNDAPSVPGNFNLVPPIGYLASWGVAGPIYDYSTFSNYYQINATFTLNGREWTSSGGTGAWADPNNWANNLAPKRNLSSTPAAP